MIENIKERKKIYEKLGYIVHRFKLQMMSLGFIKIILILTGLATPYFYKILIDDVMIGKNLDMLKWVCAGYLGLYFIETIVLYFQRKIGNRVYNKITFDVRVKLWKIYLNMSTAIYDKYKSGDLKNRIDNDTNIFEKFINNQLINYLFFWGKTVFFFFLLLII